MSIKRMVRLGFVRKAEIVPDVAILRQALLEVQHAREVGPTWFTKGEQGMRSHIQSWLRRGNDAAARLGKKLEL